MKIKKILARPIPADNWLATNIRRCWNLIQDMYEQILLILDAFGTIQETLVSGKTIKTVDGYTILGEGNIDLKERYYIKSQVDAKINDIPIKKGTGSNSAVGGFSTRSNGYYSIAYGLMCENNALCSAVFGFYNNNNTPYAFIAGSDNYNTPAIFAIGDGDSAANRSNALTLAPDGKFYLKNIGGHTGKGDGLSVQEVINSKASYEDIGSVGELVLANSPFYATMPDSNTLVVSDSGTYRISEPIKVKEGNYFVKASGQYLDCFFTENATIATGQTYTRVYAPTHSKVNVPKDGYVRFVYSKTSAPADHSVILYSGIFSNDGEEIESIEFSAGNNTVTIICKNGTQKSVNLDLSAYSRVSELNAVKSIAETAKTIAEGKSNSKVFATKAAMDTWIASYKSELKTGDNLYIIATDTPDYWWDGTQAQILETQKVDLSPYAKSADYNYLHKEEVPANYYTLLIGEDNTNNGGGNAFIIGRENSGNSGSLIMGRGNSASHYALVYGDANYIYESSYAFGYALDTTKNREIALGSYNKSENDTIVSIGNGTNSENRHNIFEIKSNGKGYVNGTEIMTDNHITLDEYSQLEDKSGIYFVVPNE